MSGEIRMEMEVVGVMADDHSILIVKAPGIEHTRPVAMQCPAPIDLDKVEKIFGYRIPEIKEIKGITNGGREFPVRF